MHMYLALTLSLKVSQSSKCLSHSLISSASQEHHCLFFLPTIFFFVSNVHICSILANKVTHTDNQFDKGCARRSDQKSWSPKHTLYNANKEASLFSHANVDKAKMMPMATLSYSVIRSSSKSEKSESASFRLAVLQVLFVFGYFPLYFH